MPAALAWIEHPGPRAAPEPTFSVEKVGSFTLRHLAKTRHGWCVHWNEREGVVVGTDTV